MAKKKFQIKGWYYISGPLALVALILMDVLAGLNFPGYNWIRDSYKQYLAYDSNSRIIAVLFLTIYIALAIFCVYCLYRYLKEKKIFNKLIKIGLIGLATMFVLSFISFGILNTDNATSLADINKYSKDVYTTETVTNDDGNTETKEVVDEAATQANHDKLGEILSKPDTLVNSIVGQLTFLVGLASYILLLIGFFKKNGNIVFACFTIATLVFLLFGSVACNLCSEDMFGLYSRFPLYCDALFVALSGGFVFVTHKEK